MELLHLEYGRYVKSPAKYGRALRKLSRIRDLESWFDLIRKTWIVGRPRGRRAIQVLAVTTFGPGCWDELLDQLNMLSAQNRDREVNDWKHELALSPKREATKHQEEVDAHLDEREHYRKRAPGIRDEDPAWLRV